MLILADRLLFQSWQGSETLSCSIKFLEKLFVSSALPLVRENESGIKVEIEDKNSPPILGGVGVVNPNGDQIGH